MINKQKSKVVFAEADSHVVDVLLSFLTFPLGKMVRILENHYGNEAPVVGSLTTLYRGLFNLDSTHFCVVGAKQMLLNPRSSFEYCSLKLGIIDDRRLAVYFGCQDSECRESQASNISCYSDIATCDCGKPLNRELFSTLTLPFDADAGVFIMKTASFIICDDLRVVPVVSGFLQTLNNLGITFTDTDGAELTTLIFGIDDVSL
ncbi:hypothetical protein C2S52_011745 [Perilla frutescens var. hirtella]|nr:hypothetical protein C2S52_011745 [Perilla frutescens var. hirtella]KAH6785630.1 hypothetical protein C2S51_038085 [Perilla frutescens var. frutescens]